jgi:hypothetical protein
MAVDAPTDSDASCACLHPSVVKQAPANWKTSIPLQLLARQGREIRESLNRDPLRGHTDQKISRKKDKQDSRSDEAWRRQGPHRASSES